jgi:hypothetical protein
MKPRIADCGLRITDYGLRIEDSPALPVQRRKDNRRGLKRPIHSPSLGPRTPAETGAGGWVESAIFNPQSGSGTGTDTMKRQ